MSEPHMIQHADGWKRRWLAAVLVLAAVMGLGIFLAAVLCAYGQSHYDYLTSLPALTRPAGPA